MYGFILLLTIAMGAIWVFVFLTNSTPIYHDYFYSIRAFGSLSGYSGRQAVVRSDANSWAIVDIETGREIKHFQNGRHEYQLVYFSTDSIVYVRRIRNHITDNGFALDDVKGEKLVRQ